MKVVKYGFYSRKMSDSSPKRPQKTGPTYRFATDQDGSTEEGSKPQGYLAPFNPTDITAQQAALDMMKLTSEDVLYDLGCGDGRFLFAAFLSVKGGLNCVGVEVRGTGQNFKLRHWRFGAGGTDCQLFLTPLA